MKYNLKLVGIVFFIILSFSIKVNSQQLTASFLASAYEISAGECVNFTDMSTGNPTGWLWSFPGSETPTSTVKNPQNICYYTPGTYDVILEVQNATNVASTSITGCITVLPNTSTPISNFVADYTTVPVGIGVNFTNLSQNGPFVSYAWSFPGGIPSQSNDETPVPVVYTQTGTYNVELRVEDENGQQSVKLRQNYIKVVPQATVPPVANFVADRTIIQPGDYINFRDLSTGTPYIWKWHFEGGSPSTSNLQNPTGILYAMPGTYDVMLIVESNKGIDTLVKPDYILVSTTDPCVTMPKADFVANQRLIRSGTRVFFENRSTNLPTTSNWYFQGGYPTYSATANPLNGVEYNVAGFFDVSLSVNNACGSDYLYKDDYILVFSGPVEKYCDTISNVGPNESIVSPTLAGSWGRIGGHNGQRIKIYADKYEQHSFTQIDALFVPIVKAKGATYNSKVKFIIWLGNTTYPDSIIWQKDVFIRNLSENFFNTIEINPPLQIEGSFFAGYQLTYYDTNNDGIQDDEEVAVSIVQDRNYPTAHNTLFVNSNNQWTTATAKFGIKTSSAMRIATCIVDVEEIKLRENLTVYPNPASDFIKINLGENLYAKEFSVKIFDLTGRVIKSSQHYNVLEEIEINTSDFNSGLYLVQMDIDGKRISRRIMISKSY
jgi:PKD repeat protein